MNAPATPAAVSPNVVMLAVGALKPSSTHIQELRRSRFKPEAIAELADSITQTGGVLQPIVVRPNGKGYEIVAGERRWLATRRARMETIAASVRELSDDQVLEIQLIENLQREGLHELEEAEGYDELKKLKGVTEEVIADMVGKSKSYVQKRAKLLALCPEARQAFYGGALDFSKALLIARIGHHDTQREALKHVTKGEYGRGPMTFKEASVFILKNYMLRLKQAPFDTKDEQLVPKAGSCTKCPKRTGNQRDLFGDVKDADTCTDPKCYDEKRQVGMDAEREALEAKGKKVVFGADAKKIFPDWNSEHDWARNRMTGGYQKLADTTWASGKQKKISEILGEGYEPILVQHPGTGAIVKLATQQAVSTAAAKLSRGSRKKAGKAKATHGMSAEERQFQETGRIEVAKRILALVKSKHDGKLGAEEIGFAVTMALQDLPEESDFLWEMFGLKDPGWKVEKAIEKAQSKDLPKLIAIGLVANVIFDNYGPSNDVGRKILKRLKIDEKGIEKDVRAELKKKADEAKAKAAPASKAKAKKK